MMSKRVIKPFIFHGTTSLFVIAIISVIHIFIGCATTGEAVESSQNSLYPDWYTDEGLEEMFPSSLYVREIGSGKTKQDAENDAVSYISRYFETEASYSSVSSLSGITEDDTTVVVEKTDINKIITSNMKLFGIQCSDSFYNEKESAYYVVAYIDREKAWNQYEPELRMEKDKFMSYYNTAEKESEAIYKIKMLNEALSASKEFNEKLFFANALSKKLTDKNFGSDIKTLTNLPSMIKEKLSSTKIFISVDDDFSGIIADAVRDVFAKKDFSVTADKSNATYVAQINVEYNRDNSSSRVVLNPCLSLSLVGNSGSIYTIGVECPHVVAPNEQAAKKMAANDLSEEIGKKLPDDIKSRLGL